MNNSKQDSTKKGRIALLYVTVGGFVTITVIGGGGYLAVKNGWLTISQGKGSVAVQGSDNITQQGNGDIADSGATVSKPTITATGDGSTLSNDVMQGK